MGLPDPPGNTVFVYLRELSRKELQAEAKEHGIKANLKNETLRQKLQVIMTARKEKDDSPDKTTLEQNASVTPENCENAENNILPLQQTVVVQKEEEPRIVGTPLAESNHQNDATTKHTPTKIDSPTHTMSDNKKPPTITKTPKARRVLGERNMNCTPSPTRSNNNKDNKICYNRPPTITKTPKPRRLLEERNMNTKRCHSNSKNNKINGGLHCDALASKKSEIPRLLSPGTVRDVSRIIKSKNSPPMSNRSRGGNTNSAFFKEDAKTTPVKLVTNTQRPRPKPMPMSKRNELQYQKFLERQKKGRKARQEKLRLDHFAHLVRSPVRA